MALKEGLMSHASKRCRLDVFCVERCRELMRVMDGGMSELFKLMGRGEVDGVCWIGDEAVHESWVVGRHVHLVSL